jgi:DNA polymerase-1
VLLWTPPALVSAAPWLALAQPREPQRKLIVDTEFKLDGGEQSPTVWCLTVKDIMTGEERAWWRDDLLKMRRPPFDIGPETLVIAYYAVAEWRCFLALGWPLPAAPLDLFGEFRAVTNRFIPREFRGKQGVDGRSMYAALRHFGLSVGDAERKITMRELAMTKSATTWTRQEEADLLAYCADDTRREADLFATMQPLIDMGPARLRGLYTCAVAIHEHNGIPLDAVASDRLVRHRDTLIADKIGEIEAHYGLQLYDDGSWSTKLFESFLQATGKPWRYAGGKPKLDDKTFARAAEADRFFEVLRYGRSHINDLRTVSLKIGSDGRNRCMSSPFKSATGRTQPSSSEHIQLTASWRHHLIKPPEGHGLAVLDFRAEEYVMMAVLAGDEATLDDYANAPDGDVYLEFGRRNLLVPADATEATHPVERGQCKVVCLATIYGQEEHGLAARLKITLAEARALLRRHRLAHRPIWQFRDQTRRAAMDSGLMVTKFGWKWRPVPFIEPNGWVHPPSRRAIYNFPCQAGATHILHIAAILTVCCGIELVGTMHDSLMIVAPLPQLDEAVAVTADCMRRASNAVIGVDLKIDAKSVRWPDRLAVKRGRETWDRITARLDQLDLQ